MPRPSTVDAVVLATYDVGEADRYCILFTREMGKIAARASGVRKPRSRIGASLLPFHRSVVDLTEHRTGFVITGARRHAEHVDLNTMNSFLIAAEATELLLILLQDGDPLPELFVSTVELLGSTAEPEVILPFSIRLLHLLGLLPSIDHAMFEHVSETDRQSIERWALGAPLRDSAPSPVLKQQLHSLCDVLLREHIQRERRVPNVSGALR